MAGSVLGFWSWGAAGPHGTPGRCQGEWLGRMDVSARLCHEGRRAQVWELSEEQCTSGAMETTAGGMQGPYCQIHCFVEDCIQSYGLIRCLSIGISSFLKCFW